MRFFYWFSVSKKYGNIETTYLLPESVEVGVNEGNTVQNCDGVHCGFP